MCSYGLSRLTYPIWPRYDSGPLRSSYEFAASVLRGRRARLLGQMGKLKGKILAESRGGSVMRLVHKLVVFLGLAFFWASPTFGATITGNVTGPDGKPLMGVFVVAENAQSI